MAAAKLSDYQIRRIIRLYAEGISAVQASQQVRASYLTVRRIFNLVRKRMLELGIYQTLYEHYRAMDEREKEGPLLSEIPLLDHLSEAIRKGRRGARGDQHGLHVAEQIYRFVQRDELGSKLPTVHYAEIVHLVRLSGPLNRPMTAKGEQRATDYLIWRDSDALRIMGLKLDEYLRQIEEGTFFGDEEEQR